MDAAPRPAAGATAALQLVGSGSPAPEVDSFEVFVCAVPTPTADPLYGEMTLRLDLDPAQIASTFESNVRPYFETLSHGRYHPTFSAGSVITLADDELHDRCIDEALDASEPSAAAVIVVADAEHLATEPGGWGRAGAPCAAAKCPAAVTRRMIYVGASDFSPDYGPVPLLDLVEHEIGHSLGLPHSGDPGAESHASGLDMMSDSAAPRQFQPDRKNAQDTLAINRLALGWLGVDAVQIADPNAGGTFELANSPGTSGTRLLVLPVSDDVFVSVELLDASGLDDFLPHGGLAVHRIDQSPSACGRTGPAAQPCTGQDRTQITLGSTAPHLDLMHQPGDSLSADGWSITVGAGGALAGGTVQVEVHPTQR